MNLHHPDICSIASEPSVGSAGSSRASGGKPAAATSGHTGARKLITMAQIARVAGVSQGAISSLLNDRDYGIRVSPQTSERVFKTCRELGYVPSDLRAVVRVYPELGETCLLVSARIPGGLANPFVTRIAAALMAKSAAHSSGIAVSLHDETRDYGLLDGMPAPVKHGTASRILFIGAANQSIVATARHRGNPGIVLGHTATLAGTTSVVPDYVAAVRSALGVFARHGHKRVGIVGGSFASDEPRISEMYCAIGSAFHEAGLPIEAQDIHNGSLDFECGIQALHATLARSSRPTALLCLSEATAAGVLAAAHARGVSVPGQLSVIAVVDHGNLPASCLPLTAVVLPADQMAAAAMEEAGRQLRDGVPADARKIVVGTTLIERMTCGPVVR